MTLNNQVLIAKEKILKNNSDNPYRYSQTDVITQEGSLLPLPGLVSGMSTPIPSITCFTSVNRRMWRYTTRQ